MVRYFSLSQPPLRIPCKIYEPEFGQLKQCILGVHGFGADKDTELLATVSEEMSIFGAATVCFDLPAHGESPMGSDMLTLDNCIDALLYAAKWTRNRYPDVDFCIFASGFGAYLTLIAIDRIEELVGKVKLVLHTPNLRMSEMLLAITGMSEEQLLEAGHATVKAPRWLDISFDFYKQVRNYTALTIYDMPMLLLHGEKDRFLPIEDMINFRRINEGCKLVVVPEADHQFRSPGAMDMVVDLTRDWFASEQVLLCDWS